MRHFGRKPFSFLDLAQYWVLISYFSNRSGNNYGIQFWMQFTKEQLENYFNRLVEVE